MTTTGPVRTLGPVDVWEPQQVGRFAAERRKPFRELVEMCAPVDGGLVYDLGCGTGTLTEELHAVTKAGRTIGVDASPAMLAAAAAQCPDVSFESGDLATFAPESQPDLIMANASLQWVDDHAAVIERWRSQLAPSGQLAIQMPADSDHPAFSTAATVATKYASAFANGIPPLTTSRVEPAHSYARLLSGLGATDLWVSVRVFCHRLPSTSEVVEWLKGTTLNSYKAAMDTSAYRNFLDEYTGAMYERLGQHEPYLFRSKRILMWAQFS